MNALNIVFAGTPEFGLPCLEALNASEHRLKAIYTQPDRPAGRGRQLQASAVKAWALEHALPVYQPLHFKEEETREALSKLAPDVLVVIAYGLILPESVLAIPRFGAINVHASLLPQWRGASPIQHAIWYGDSKGGVSIMQMDKGMDTGAVFMQAHCPIEAQETSASLHDKLAKLSAQPLLETLAAISTGQAQALPQAHSEASYTKKIQKEDAQINWQDSAVAIDRLIRAFIPWPIAFSQVGEERIRIYQAQVLPENSSKAPGSVLKMDKSGLYVACGEHILCIQKIQFPGSKVLSIADCLHGHRLDAFHDQVFA